jgi:hypothetical protein
MQLSPHAMALSRSQRSRPQPLELVDAERASLGRRRQGELRFGIGSPLTFHLPPFRLALVEAHDGIVQDVRTEEKRMYRKSVERPARRW